MKSGKKLRLAVLFSLTVFVTLNLTLMILGLLMGLLAHFGLLDFRTKGMPMIILAVFSVIVGTFFSLHAGRKPIGMLKEISDATKEIAKGNYNVHLDENVQIEEIQTMAKNFNLMARELAGTELLRSDFIENVSHEFKTPLASIEGYAMLLQQKTLPDEKRLEYTGRILASTRSLSSLTGNILLLSHLENQQMEVKKSRFSLDEQLRETILALESDWANKNLDLDIDLDSVDCNGCQDLLFHVWQNLIGNAIKFTSVGGFIHIRLRQSEGNAVVAISDNGCGMSTETVTRIFEKFYQGDQSRHCSGNGLGLSLAKRIIDLHHGSIDVQSSIGAGSTFTVTIPL